MFIPNKLGVTIHTVRQTKSIISTNGKKNHVVPPHRGWLLPIIFTAARPFRSTRVRQCWASLWRASCWGRPPPNCSRSSHHWTVPWRPFTTRAALGGGHWRSPRTCLSRGWPNAPADASRRTCVSHLPIPTLACSPQVCFQWILLVRCWRQILS